MKRLTILLMISLTALAYAAWIPSNQIFTYQGRIYDDDVPVDGTVDLRLYLWDDSDPNTAEAVGFQSFQDQPVSNGYITLKVNLEQFPGAVEGELFDGSDRWLGIEIRNGQLDDPNDYHELSPWLKLEATPFAHAAYRLKTPAALRGETAEPTLTVGNTGAGAALYFEDEVGSVEYGYDADTSVAHDLTLDIGNSQFVTVDADSTEHITGDRTLTVENRETKTVGGNSDTTIGAARTALIGGQDELTVVGNSTATVGGHETKIIGGNSTTTVGMDIKMAAANSMLLNAGQSVRLQNGVSVSNDPNDLLAIDGAVTLQPMTDVPATAGSGKVFVNDADGKLYYIDTAGTVHDVTAVTDDRISFTVKRDAPYAWPTSTLFETVDFSSQSSEWDNTGGGYNDKNSTFVAPADGLYTFSGAIFFTDLSKGDLIAAAISAAGKRYRGDAKTAGGEDESVRAVVTVYLHAADTVTLEGYVSTTAPPVTVHGTASGTDAVTYFNGARVN